MVTIARAARQVKEDLPSLIAPIVSQALESHPGFHWRQRVLDPLNLMLLFIRSGKGVRMICAIIHPDTFSFHLFLSFPLFLTPFRSSSSPD